MSSELLEEICIHYESAISQRKSEVENGLGLNGTSGYAKTGCYSCSGYNKECSKYLTWKDLEWVKDIGVMEAEK